MRYYSITGLAALAGCWFLSPEARADVFVRAPFVTVHVGPPGVYVGVFGRPVAVVANSPAPMRKKTTKRQIETLPAPRPVPEVEEPVPTLAEFVESFRPSRGEHDVMVVHPVTKKPVNVSFKLPAGKPKQVRIQGRELGFDYGNREVAIRFLRDGRVRVLYD